MKAKNDDIQRLAELVTEIACANGMTIDATKIAKTIKDQNSIAFPIIAQSKNTMGSVYYIVYAQDKTKATPKSLQGLSELDITVKLRSTGGT